MATLSRVTAKLFGGNAPLGEIGQFGSAKAGSPLNTQDVATIQALPAYANGWGSAIMTSRNFPPIEEVTGVLKTLSYQNCYTLQEGVPVYDINTNYSATSIVKVVNGTNLSFYVSLVDDNIGNPLSDSTKWAKATFGERNLGEVITSLLPLTDAGLHLLDGSLLSGSGIYAAFVSHIASIYNSSLNYFCSEADWQTSVSTYGVCGKFVYDSVNNTVRLPKVTGFVEGTIDVSALGDLVEAGLPNITGSIEAYNDYQNEASGCFTARQTGAVAKGGTTYTGGFFDFNASRSSSIYGNSSTVQPQAINGFMYIVIATSTKTNIEVDIDDIATDLNGKADVDLSNTNDTAKILMSGMGMPSETYVDLTLGASGTTYTAPANGWVQVGIRAGAAQKYIHLCNDTTGVQTQVHSVTSTDFMQTFIPVNKGDSFYIDYNATGTENYMTFIYANGSESEASST